MVARAVIAGVAVAGGLALGSCSYTKADDSPVPSRTTIAVAPTARVSVVGTLPPITNAPTTVAVTVAPAGATTAPATTAATAPPATPAKPAPTNPPATKPPATHTGGPVTVQAGAFSTQEAADQAVAILASKGFGGFGVSGSGPFRVVRGGLSGADGDALVGALAAAGIAAFVRG